MGWNYEALSDTARNCAWQTTDSRVRSDGTEQNEKLRGRLAEVNHFRDPQKAGDMSKLYDRSLRLWIGTILVSSGHNMGKYTNESWQVLIHLAQAILAQAILAQAISCSNHLLLQHSVEGFAISINFVVFHTVRENGACLGKDGCRSRSPAVGHS